MGFLSLGRALFSLSPPPSLAPAPGIGVEAGAEWRNQLGDGQSPGGQQGISCKWKKK